jgi:predicted patatin/cPLA2 family phospholipase
VTLGPSRQTKSRDRASLVDHLRMLADSPASHRRPALIVQGGGLRAIYSMAALALLEEMGLREAFSVVAGSSSGAINGAYFLAGQAREGLDIYYKCLSSRRFLSPWRIWKVMDVDYLVDVTLKQHLPLDLQGMLAASAPLYTILTDAETAEPVVVSSRDETLDIYEVLRATVAIPGLYNRKVSIGSRKYVDGGLTGLVPLRMVVNDGEPEAVVLLTRARGHCLKGHGPVYYAASRVVAYGQSPQVRAHIRTGDPTYNTTMEALEREQTTSPRTTWTLRPTNADRMVGRTTSNLRRLRDCAALGRSDMMTFLQKGRLCD